VLQQFAQLDYRQIGRRVEVTPTAVQALLRRARRHPRRSLAGDAIAN
jgi:DNA-directed RNA polymerase specialized sigma24 family protein